MIFRDSFLWLGVVGALTVGCGKVADEPAGVEPALASSAAPPPSAGPSSGTSDAPVTPVATPASPGVRPPPNSVCGTRGGITCPAGTYCKFDDQCGRADGGGKCVTPDSDCADPVVDPVCGCDDRSYVSSCDAALHGVSIKAFGRCEDFACGKATCDAETSYCEADDTGGGTCKSLPPACKPTAGGAPPDCSCFFLTDGPCGGGCPDQCSERPAGSVSAFTLTWSN